MDQSHDEHVREPIRSPWVWVVMSLIVLAGTPLYLPAGVVEPLVFGIPYWMVVSVFFTLAFAAFTSWLCLGRWNLVEQREEAAAEAGDGGMSWEI